MTRLPRLLLAALTLNAALVAGALAAPVTVAACSCAATEVKDFVGDPKYAIVAGLVEDVRPGIRTEQIGTFFVRRVFQGIIPGPQLQIEGGGGGDCTVHIETGMELIAVAGFEGDTLHPFLCLPYGDLRDRQGQAVLAEVQAHLGPGVMVGEPEPSQEVTAIASVSTVAIVAVVALLAMVLAVVLSAIRRGDPDTPAP
jgi:hypothetical protein